MSHRSSSGGFSAIEQALVIPFIVMLVLGAIDVSNILRARYTADEGVRSALRCAVTTEGPCAPSLNASPRSVRYFNVALLPPVEVQVPVVGVDAHVEYLTVQPEAYVPVVKGQAQVQYQYSTFYTKNFANARVSYLVETLPYIERLSGSTEEYRFSSSQLNSRGEVVPTSAQPPMVRLMGGATLRSEGGQAAKRSFTLRGITASALPLTANGSFPPCARDTDLSQRETPLPCRTTAQSVPAFIYIKGRSPTLTGTADREYQAEVELSITIGDSKRDLGGRRFIQRIKVPSNTTYPSYDPASLVPRGASTTQVSSDAKASREEFAAHQNLNLPIGKPFTVELSVFPSGKTTLPVEWQIESIDLVLPDYSPREERVRCSTPLDVCQFDAKRCEFTSAFGNPATVPFELEAGQEVMEENYLGCFPNETSASEGHRQDNSCARSVTIRRGLECGRQPGAEYLWENGRFSVTPDSCGSKPTLATQLPPNTELIRLERISSDAKPVRVATVTQKELKDLREGTDDKYRCDRFERKEIKLTDLPDLNWKKPDMMLLLACTNDPRPIVPALPEGVYLKDASFIPTGRYLPPPSGTTIPECLPIRYAPKIGPVESLGEFKEGELPEICSSRVCTSTLSRQVALSDQATSLPDLKMAEKVGMASMQGLFGQLSQEGSYSGKVETRYLTKTGESPRSDLSDATTVEVTTTVTVPSLLSVPGSGATHQVTSTRSQRIERSFIR